MAELHITEKQVTMIDIEGADRLDPISLILENYEPGKGRITIRCYAQAWALTAYWGAMSGRTVEQFVMDCNPDYIRDNLEWGRQPVKKRDEDYFLRIVKAVQQALRQRAAHGVESVDQTQALVRAARTALLEFFSLQVDASTAAKVEAAMHALRDATDAAAGVTGGPDIAALLIAHRDMIEAQQRGDREAEVAAIQRMEAAAGMQGGVEVDQDDDGELLIDWSPGAGRIVTLSLRADGRLSWAFTWDGEKAHGTAQMPVPHGVRVEGDGDGS